jgi:hypothetical protein
VPRLASNSTYVVRMRVRNAAMEKAGLGASSSGSGDTVEWSEWSKNLTLSTHSDRSKKLGKHRIHQMHQHRHRKHKSYAQSGQSGSRDLNSDSQQGWLGNEYSSAPSNTLFSGSLSLVLVMMALAGNFV